MLQTETRLDDFEIIRLLGRGGMGEVYEARQLHPDRRVAIKVLAPWLADDEEALQRFWREAEVPANLDHPGIVRIISTGKTADGIAYFAMHLVRGISLSEMIRRASAATASDVMTKSLEINTPSMEPTPRNESAAAAPASPTPESPAPGLESSPQMLTDYRRDRFTTTARIGAQAARALAYAHDQGHIHRDIKPSNLMVDHHDHVYLVDFGLTRGLGPTGSGTQAGVAVGTPWYMSPEQAEGQPLDHRSDIYSLGVTLYELATQGLGPFTANREDKRSVIEQVRAGQTLPLRTLAPGIPPELERIILKAMQLKPYKRYECAAEMAHDLEAFVGIVSKKNSRPPAPTESAPGRTRWLWLGGGIAVAVLGVILGSIALWTALATAPVRDRKDDGGIEERNRGRLDGTNAMPVELRGQQLGLHFPLFKENKEPLWKEKLFGRVGYIPYPTNFTLVNNNKSLGILGIADPDRHSFEFSVDVGRIGSTQQENDMSVGRCGIVFGWRRHLAEADSHHRFFNLEFDQQPDWAGGFGNLMIGTGWLVPPAPNRGIGGEFFKRLPGERSILPLRQFRGFHRVHLKVRKDGFAVSVGDGGLVYNITLDTIREFEPLAAPHLDPRGTIGLWVMNGNAEFRNPKLLLRADP